ncbi:hypothetical protein HMPREF9057_01696 [Actinomyces sp. oral taxon 171 str. F0337]|nr:hypothetical protein HMPREF9057_01696 [Actinomyces sp. oral taxon 171 str. F0337]
MLYTSGGSVAAHASSSLGHLPRAGEEHGRIQWSIRPPAVQHPGSGWRSDPRAVPWPDLRQRDSDVAGGSVLALVITMTSVKRDDVNHPRG